MLTGRALRRPACPAPPPWSGRSGFVPRWAPP